MTLPPTQQTLDLLEHHDAFLHACLGLRALLPQFDQHFAQLVLQSETTPAPEAHPEELMHIALGLIALRMQLGVVFENVARNHIVKRVELQSRRASTWELLR